MKQEDFKRILDKLEPDETIKDKILSSKKARNQLRKRLITVAASFAMLLLTTATVLAAINYFDLADLFRSTFDDNITAKNIEEGKLQELGLTQINEELSLTLNSFAGDSETQIVLFEMEYFGEITEPIESITLTGKTTNITVKEEEKANYGVTKFKAYEVTCDENTRKIFGKYILPTYWVGDGEDVVIDIIEVEIQCQNVSQRIQIATNFEYTFTPDRSILKAALSIPVNTDISKNGEILTIDNILFSQYKTEIFFTFHNSSVTIEEEKALCERFTFDYYKVNSFKWVINDCYIQLYAEGTEVKTKDLFKMMYPGYEDTKEEYHWAMDFQPVDYNTTQNIEIRFGDTVIPLDIPQEQKNADQSADESAKEKNTITDEEAAFAGTVENATDAVESGTIENAIEPEEITFEGLISDKTTPLLGNSCSNLNVGGYICPAGDSVYYRNDKDHGCLYRLNTDGTKSKIYDGSVSYINVMGDYIYFIDEDRAYYICRVDLNGDNYKVISTINATGLILTQDQIFFTGKFSYSYLYKMDLEGQQVTQLSDRLDAWWVNIYKGYLIYSGAYDDLSVYCYDLAASKDYKIMDQGFFPVVDGDNLYYQSKEGVTSCSLSDGSSTVLTEEWGQQFAVVQEAVYFTDYKNLWKYPLNGVTPTKIILNGINKEGADKLENPDISINWICAGSKDIFINITEDDVDKIIIYDVDTGITEEL